MWVELEASDVVRTCANFYRVNLVLATTDHVALSFIRCVYMCVLYFCGFMFLSYVFVICILIVMVRPNCVIC